MAEQMRGRTRIGPSGYQGHPRPHPSLASLVLPQSCPSLQGGEVVGKRETPFPVTTLLPCVIGQYRKKRKGSLANGLTHQYRPLHRWASSGSPARKRSSISSVRADGNPAPPPPSSRGSLLQHQHTALDFSQCKMDSC